MSPVTNLKQLSTIVMYTYSPRLAFNKQFGGEGVVTG